MTLIFLVSSIEQPRIVKRILHYAKHYSNVKVYYFSRNLHEVGNFNKLFNVQNLELIKVGKFKDRSYFGRLGSYLKLLLMLNGQNLFDEKKIYTFGLDLRIISLFSIKSVSVYEISDVFWLYTKGIVRKALRTIDFALCSLSNEIVFTSEAFYKEHYNFLPSEKVSILENKLQTYGKVWPLETIENRSIVIGYIGAFRYLDIITDLIEICGDNPNKLKLLIYGDAPTATLEIIKKKTEIFENVKYLGPFRNPEDLQNIYSSINVNFVAYDNKLKNEQVAMPNKFYESGYFNIPIVCSEGTFVGEKVNDFQMGWSIEPTKEGIKYFLDKLTLEEIENCHNRIKRISKEKFAIYNE